MEREEGNEKGRLSGGEDERVSVNISGPGELERYEKKLAHSRLDDGGK